MTLDGQPPEDLIPHALYLHGQLQAAQSNWEAMAVCMRRLVEEHPDHSLTNKAAYWMAEASFRGNDFEAARQSLERLVAAHAAASPDWLPMAELRLAQIEGHAQRWSAALTKATAIMTRHPDFGQRFEAEYLIGRCQASLGDFAVAREAYRRVLQSPAAAKTETAAMAQWMIGESFMHGREYQAAIVEYLRVESIHAWPEWQAAGLLQAANAYVALERPRPAVEALSRLMKKFPQTEFAIQATNQLAQLNALAAQYEVALQAEEKRQE